MGADGFGNLGSETRKEPFVTGLLVPGVDSAFGSVFRQIVQEVLSWSNAAKIRQGALLAREANQAACSACSNCETGSPK